MSCSLVSNYLLEHDPFVLRKGRVNGTWTGLDVVSVSWRLGWFWQARSWTGESGPEWSCADHSAQPGTARRKPCNERSEAAPHLHRGLVVLPWICWHSFEQLKSKGCDFGKTVRSHRLSLRSGVIIKRRSPGSSRPPRSFSFDSKRGKESDARETSDGLSNITWPRRRAGLFHGRKRLRQGSPEGEKRRHKTVGVES